MKYFLLLIAYLFAACCNGQEKCGTSEQYAWLMQNVPEYARLMQNRPKDSYVTERISNTQIQFQLLSM